MIRRIISFIILMVMLLSVFSCGNNSDDVTETETADSNTIEINMDNYSKYLKISEMNIENYGLSDEVIDYRDGYKEILYGYEKILPCIQLW